MDLLRLRTPIRFLVVSAFLKLGGVAEAGRHSQTTHSTPKGYHHDGTPHYDGEVVFLLIVIGIALVAVIVHQLMAAGFSSMVSGPKNQQPLTARQFFWPLPELAGEIRRAFLMLINYSLAVPGKLVRLVKGLPEVVQAILGGFAIAMPGVALVVWAFTRK